MNLLLVDPVEVGPQRVVVLDERRSGHLRNVLAVATGQVLRAGVIGHGHCDATVLGDDGSAIEVRLGEVVNAIDTPTVSLILALPRPKVLRRVLRQAAAWGLARIDLVNAWRVDKSYWGSSRTEAAALRAEVVLGCEQGKHVWVPEVVVHRLLMPFVASQAGVSAAKLVLDPRALQPLEVCLPIDPSGIVMAIGPEGGWIEAELASLQDVGFVPTSLGAPVLSVESAVTASLAELAVVQRIRRNTGAISTQP